LLIIFAIFSRFSPRYVLSLMSFHHHRITVTIIIITQYCCHAVCRFRQRCFDADFRFFMLRAARRDHSYRCRYHCYDDMAAMFMAYAMRDMPCFVAFAAAFRTAPFSAFFASLEFAIFMPLIHITSSSPSSRPLAYFSA